jgi:type IV secretory pathway VirB10-like protein
MSRGVTRGVAIVTVVLATAIGLAASGCAKAKAQVVPDGPPLAMPAPPSRVLVPTEEPLAAVPAVQEVPVATAPRAATRPPVRRPAPVADTEPRDPAPVVPAEPPPSVVGPAELPRELRAAPAAADAAAERQIRDLLMRATRDLGRTDYRKLTAEGREQYEQSKRFADQAEQALKERNFVFATTLADKAATLAGALGGG